MTGKQHHNLRLGLAFLAPNICGFLAFTLVPLVFSLVLAFSNWDLKLQNMFKNEPIRFVGFDNFRRLLSHPEFYHFLGNTLFFMMGIPFGIAGSLILALLLNRNMRGGNRRVFAALVIGALLTSGVALLLLLGASCTALTVLLCVLAGGMLVGGVIGGSTVYRTLLYIPSFTAGVAIFILWKKLYNPNVGPVNNFLAGPLAALTRFVRVHPGVAAGAWFYLALLAVLLILGLHRIRRNWTDGELGSAAVALPAALVVLPVVLGQYWLPVAPARYALALVALVGLLGLFVRMFRRRGFPCALTVGFGGAVLGASIFMVAELVLVGLALVCWGLPGWVRAPAGLTPPEWLTSYHWAKPAIMIMGFWAAVGSNNMLLYLAGLSNVPQDLYEAAAIDGASGLKRFWNVTWPQLAPTTFFIVVMSVIGGLQGGFEMARTMTHGGPAGATTTLSYFIYTEGFETGRLGYSSAVSWVLFVLVFSVTLFNWKFGSRYVND